VKLAPKLAILILVAAFLPTVIVGYLAYDNSRRTILKETIKHLTSINSYKSNELERWVEDSRGSLEELAGRPLIRRDTKSLMNHEAQGRLYQKAKEGFLEAHLKPRMMYGNFLELFLICPQQGLTLVSTDERQAGKYKNNQPYYLEGKSRTTIQPVYYSPGLELNTMTIGTPIKDQQGNLLGVLAGRLDLGELSKIIEQQPVKSRTEDTYLVNAFNFFVTEPRFGRGYALKKAVRTEGVEAGLSGKSGSGFYQDYREQPVIGAYHWLPEFKMAILTEIDQKEAFAPIEELKRKIIGFGFLVALLAAAAGWFSARTITRPVHSLIEGTEAIGGGLLDHPLSLSGKDEIGNLSRAFSRMAGKLRETMVSRDELSKEVVERQQAERELQEKNAELERFTYTISHDLKSPLVTIKSFLGYLEQDLVGAEPEKVKQDFFYMNSAADKMGQLLNELLEMSRIGRISNTSVRLPFREVVDEALSLLAGPIAQRGAAVRVNDAPLTFFGDRPRLVEIWQNLVENAVKYMGDQGSPEIEIGVEGRGRKAVFWVRDNGQGIDPRHQGKVFGLFEKLNPESEGTGLGLALVKRIVEFYQGTIRLESPGLGQGTTVWFSLPGAVEELE
jgi:signal transduction histidine kinase